eukprot:UN29111
MLEIVKKKNPNGLIIKINRRNWMKKAENIKRNALRYIQTFVLKPITYSIHEKISTGSLRSS